MTPGPAVLVVVAGTGTDVGKTWLSARLVDAWRSAGHSVAARKPAQSYAPGTGPTDAEVLGAASGEDPTTVCPESRSYGVPLAPPMAADALGLPGLTVADLVDELSWPRAGVDIGLVETAGGVRSPQAHDGDVLDLVAALAPDHVVLVADAGLGTVNAVRLSVAALAGAHWRSPAPAVVLNRFDPATDLHRRNLAWLRHRNGLDVSELASVGIGPLAARLSQPAAAPGDTAPGETSTILPSFPPAAKRS